jgi:hypothetical protein
LVILRTFTHPDGRRRVAIVDRGGGRFGYEFELLDEEVGWCPQRQYPLCVCDTEVIAEREARAAFPWLGEVVD